VRWQRNTSNLAGLYDRSSWEEAIEILLTASLFNLAGHGLEYQSGAAGRAVLFTVLTQKMDHFPMGFGKLNLLFSGEFNGLLFGPVFEALGCIAVLHSHGIHLRHWLSPVVMVSFFEVILFGFFCAPTPLKIDQIRIKTKKNSKE
jgi:hypothetical protein